MYTSHNKLRATRTLRWKTQATKPIGTVSYTIVQLCQGSATGQDASLRLGAMVIHSQIPTANTNSVNMSKEFHVNHAVFRQVPCLVSKSSFEKSNNFGFKKTKQIICDTISNGDQTKLRAKDWRTCNLQCFDHVCNLLLNICHCPEIFYNFVFLK